MARHLEPQQLATAVTQYEKREQSLKGQGRNHTQVNGGDRLGVVSQEGSPPLGWVPPPHHVFRNRRLGDRKAEHQELAVNPGRSPGWIFLAHPSDEITQVTLDLWPP